MLFVLYAIMLLNSTYYVMVARFNNGLAHELGLPAGSLDAIINSDSKIAGIFAVICGWGIWLIPGYYLIQGMFATSALTIAGIFFLPSFINVAIYHPKYFAKKSLKNLYDEKKYQSSKQIVPREVELLYATIEGKLKSIIAE